MLFTTDNTIFLLAILLLLGVLTTKFSSRLGMPSLVLYVVVGMALSRFIYFDNAYITQLFGIVALIVILFEGGMQTKWKLVKPVLRPSLSLATIGVFTTTLVIGIFAKYILGVSWLEGFLFGAIVGSTDAAAIFTVLLNKNIKQRISSTLEAESGTNDPMAVFLTLSLVQIIRTNELNWLHLAVEFVMEMGLGLVAGYFLGKFAVRIINNINLDSSGLYPVLALGFAVLTYSGTALIGGSGLLAVYVMALVLGNSDLTYRLSIFRFTEGFAWMMQILMFILLGLLVFPAALLSIWPQGVLLSFILMLLARPAGVFVATAFSQFGFKEKILLSWAGLRGAVPIVLATYPMLAGLENSQLFFNVVFFVVLLSALVQGATISPLADKLKLTEERTGTSVSLELLATGKGSSAFIQVPIENDSAVIGKQIQTLEMPESFFITAIVRDEHIVTPRGNTEILLGDVLYLFVPRKQRDQVKKFFLKPE